jgi:hypothetical protein
MLHCHFAHHETHMNSLPEQNQRPRGEEPASNTLMNFSYYQSVKQCSLFVNVTYLFPTGACQKTQRYCHVVSVTIDGVWIGTRIY